MALGVTVHFFLAPFASISDNPALTKSSGIRPTDPDQVAQVPVSLNRGRADVRHGQGSRSLKKDDQGPLFHRFLTSVEIAQGPLFSIDDHSHSSRARSRTSEFLG